MLNNTNVCVRYSKKFRMMEKSEQEQEKKHCSAILYRGRKLFLIDHTIKKS